jgi:protoheme ferro-lyase
MNLYWLFSYLGAFWTTVVVQCAKPVNWQNCSSPHEWLVPYVQDYIDSRNPYSKEREILESLK